jgi:hypothetical protein
MNAYAIKIKYSSGRVEYLHSYRKGFRTRITTTSHFENARKFATEADAQQFIKENAGYFIRLDMEVAS